MARLTSIDTTKKYYLRETATQSIIAVKIKSVIHRFDDNNEELKFLLETPKGIVEKFGNQYHGINLYLNKEEALREVNPTSFDIKAMQRDCKGENLTCLLSPNGVSNILVFYTWSKNKMRAELNNTDIYDCEFDYVSKTIKDTNKASKRYSDAKSCEVDNEITIIDFDDEPNEILDLELLEYEFYSKLGVAMLYTKQDCLKNGYHGALDIRGNYNTFCSIDEAWDDFRKMILNAPNINELYIDYEIFYNQTDEEAAPAKYPTAFSEDSGILFENGKLIRY